MNPTPIDIRNTNTINKALSKHLRFAVFVENSIILKVMPLNYTNYTRRDPDGKTRFDHALDKHELVGVYSLSRNANLSQLAEFVTEDCRHLGLMN